MISSYFPNILLLDSFLFYTTQKSALQKFTNLLNRTVKIEGLNFLLSSELWAKSPRIRQSGNQLFLSSDSKYTRREPLTERLSLHIRACARVLYYCLSACQKSNSRRNFGGLSAKIIKHDHVVLNTQ